MSYYKNLDFLRFFAVGMVIFQHWFYRRESFVDFGTSGVIVFFVLSGFLITSILLAKKEKIESKELTVKRAFYNFYARRSLRIFPIYFGLIIFLVIFNYSNAIDNQLWLFSYTSNIKTYIDQSWMGSLGPLWSLAVEEQFYFIWPSVILFTKFKNLKKALVITFFVGLIFRLLAMFFAKSYFEIPQLKVSANVLVFSNMHLFALGGLLAYEINYGKLLNGFKNYFVLLFSGVLFLFAFVLKNEIFYHFIHSLVIGTWSYYIIRFLIVEDNRFMNYLNQIKPLSFLGKISYGLYLYHGPFFFIYAIISFAEVKIFSRNLLFGNYQGDSQFLFFKNIFYLILFSMLSWFIVEKPINKLKRYFV